MWKKIGNLLIILYISTLGVTLADSPITVSASVDGQTLYLFDRLIYEVSVQGSVRSIPEPHVRLPVGLKLQGNPRSSSSIQIVNGRMNSKRTLTYVLKAVKEGQWTIPPAALSYQGKNYKSKPITITVKKYTATSSSDSELNIPKSKLDNLFLWAAIDTNNPYIGQAVTVSYSVYTQLQIVDFAINEPPSYSGFWVEEIELPKEPRVETKIIQGMKYAVAEIHKTQLYPTVTGELMVDPLSMQFKIESESGNRFDDFFSPFGSRFNSPFMNFQRTETRSSQAIALNVKPLPVENKPPHFTGAVGQFTLKSALNKSEVQKGNAVIMTVTLSGNHILETLSPPALPSLSGWKTFEPKSKDTAPFPGRPGWYSKIFEYILVPHESGELTIPPVKYSYFNPKTKQYKYLQTKPMSILVTSTPGSIQNVITTSDSDSFELIGHEIRYIKSNVVISNYETPYTTAWFIIALILPVPAVPILLLYGRHKRKMMGDLAYARAFKAKGEFQKHLKSAESAFSNQNYNLVLDETARAFSSYLSNRLNLPVGGLTIAQVKDALIRRNVNAKTIDSVSDYWQQLEIIRFAPTEPNQHEVKKFLSNGQRLIKKLEKTKMKYNRKEQQG